MYMEALYNENRNAIPSWQGYNYQGEVASYKFLEYIYNQLEKGRVDLTDIIMKIEWLEDFVIFDIDGIKKIYQVKKTLNPASYNEVMENFILQFKLSEDDCTWYLAYDDVTSVDLEEISLSMFNKLYELSINKKIIDELLLLQKNMDLDYWKNNLKLKNTEKEKSTIPNIRGIVRKIMDMNSIEYKELTINQCKEFEEKHIRVLVDKLAGTEQDYSNFSKRIIFEKLKIENLKSNSIEIINNLHGKEYIQKNDIITSENIYEFLYIYVYEKLMNIKNKKTELFNISFDDIRRLFMSDDRIRLFWCNLVYKVREDLLSEISSHCEECVEQNCNICSISSFADMEFTKLIENLNLEYPKTAQGVSRIDFQNKLTEAKCNYLLDILIEFKDKINCLKMDNLIEIYGKNERLFVSANVSDDHKRNKARLIENINEHIEVYKEYSHILTKNFSEILDYEKTKIRKNTEAHFEDSEPTFMDLLPIKYIKKENLEV